MNLNLKKEIIKHIFETFGVFRSTDKIVSGFIAPINTDEFLIDKCMVFETEDGYKYKVKMYAASANIENSNVKIMIADISEDIEEFSLIIQMDNNSPCVLRLSGDGDDNGSMYFYLNENWIEVGTLAQARILVGVESLTEIFIQWQRLDNHKEIYKSLIDFLNHYFNQE